MKHKKGAIACMSSGGSMPAGATGFVPGTGSGDKIPAKYEPGEFVVSRDMLALDPKLGAHLTSLRERVLAMQGMTPEQADAKSMTGGKLRAANGFGPGGLELAPVDPVKEVPRTKMAVAMQNATRINSRLPAPAWAPGAKIQMPSIAAPNLQTSLGAAPPTVGPPAPPAPINAPSLGFAAGPIRDNRINFNTTPNPVPINATTSPGAAPGRAVVPIGQGRSFTPPYASPNANPSSTIPIPSNTSPANSLLVIGGRSPALTADAGRSFTPPTSAPNVRSTTLIPVDAGRSFTPPYGASLDPKTIYQPTNTSPSGELAVIDGRGRELTPTSQPGRTMTPPTVEPKSINIPSGYTPPKVNTATGAYASQGPAAAPATPSTPAAAPSMTQKGFGTGKQWRDALDVKNTGRLVQSANTGFIANSLGKVARGVGAVAKPLAVPLTAVQLGSALSDGRAGDAAWAGADLAASGALFTPAAPAAGAYLGARGLYEGSKLVGDAISGQLSDGTRNTIGGTINQAVRSAGNLFGKKWGVDDDALISSNAEQAMREQQVRPQAVAASAAPAAPPTQAATENPFSPAQQSAATGDAAPITNPNQINITRQPNGVMSFSGGPNIGQDGGPISYNAGSSGFKPGGAGLSVMPGASQSAGAGVPAGWSASDNAVMAANIRDGIDPYRGTSQGQAGPVSIMPDTGGFGLRDKAYLERREAGMPLGSITASRIEKETAARHLGNIDARDMKAAENSTALTRQSMIGAVDQRGQDIAAANNSAQNRLAGQRVGLEGQRVSIEGMKAAGDQTIQGFQARAAARLESAQQTLLDPKATPEQRKLAQSTLAALNGKTATDRLQTINLPDTVDASGQTVRGGQALVRMREDGSVEQVPVGAQQQAQTKPPYPEKTRLTGPDGKTYVVKDGVPVPV